MRTIISGSVQLKDLNPDFSYFNKNGWNHFVDDINSIKCDFEKLEAEYIAVLVSHETLDLSFSDRVEKALFGSEKFVLFVCTLGSIADDLIRKHKDDILKYCISDSLASIYADGVAEYIHQKVVPNYLDNDDKITNRYSPGYCGWDVFNQHSLFEYFPETLCSIKLNESALMYPVKSVSGIIGIGKDVKFAEYGCGECTNEKCFFLKTK